MATCKLTSEDCVSVIKRILPNDDVTVQDFELVPLQNQNWELKIVYYDGSVRQKIQFFVKKSPNVSKKYTMLRDINALPQLTPKLCGSKEDLYIFEDLTTQGFQNNESEFSYLNVDHLQLVLQTLAKLHGLAFAFEETKSGGRIDQEYGLSRTSPFLVQEKVKKFVDSVFDEKEAPEVMEELEKKQISSQCRRTLCHGNLQSKNIMFKYQRGAPVECRFTNFDSCYYGAPIWDVLQVIFFNSSEDLRQQHLHSLLEHYHKCLKTELEKFDLNFEEYLSLGDLQLAVYSYLPLVKLQCLLNSVKRNVGEKPEIFLKCQLLSKEDCYVIVKNTLGTTNYEFLSFDVSPLDNVSGFLGQYYRLQIKICHLNEDKTYKYFIKRNPKTGIPHDIARDLDSFKREVFMYEVLVEQMRKFSINTIDECLPPCYFHRHEDIAVFEDMSLLNFQNLDALKPMNFTLLSLATKKLARFHACSLVLEEKASFSILERYKEYFTEPLFFIDEKHLGARSFMTGMKSIPAAMELFPEIKTEEIEDNFQKFWPKLQDLFYTVVKTSDRYRNVLSHGDLWTSNMLVKFEDDKPVDCVFLDFQIVRYCPPAYDLLSVLHLTTDRQTRLKHEDELIQIYYDELSLVLQSYGYSIKSIYPYEDYIGCIKHMKPQMVVQAAIDCVLTMCTPEEISSFLTNEEVCKFVYFEDRREFLTAMCEKSELYRKRLKDCILDIYDYCNFMSTSQ